MTAKDGETQVIHLGEMLMGGGREGALAFHLLNIEYHIGVIATSGEKDDMEMLHGLLVQHQLGLEVALTALAEAGLDVVAPRLIVPGR